VFLAYIFLPALVVSPDAGRWFLLPAAAFFGSIQGFFLALIFSYQSGKIDAQCNFTHILLKNCKSHGQIPYLR
jgi:hypothetical protein